MKPLLFANSVSPTLLENLVQNHDFELGALTLHTYPDGETNVRFDSEIKGRDLILLIGLDSPNPKMAHLLFFSECARELGAKHIGLVAPYLPYMRQDKRFNPGEGITSSYFAAFISKHFDWLITIDPHLHRRKSLDEIYTIPNKVLRAENLIAEWIKHNVTNPVLIGPDSESEQHVGKVAAIINCPYVVANKTRKGDKEVSSTLPDMKAYQNHQPVLIDDIISTAQTMIEIVQNVNTLKLPAPICIGVHGIFAGSAFSNLEKAGIKKIVTCNTIAHASNAIDVSSLLIKAIKNFAN